MRVREGWGCIKKQLPPLMAGQKLLCLKSGIEFQDAAGCGVEIHMGGGLLVEKVAAQMFDSTYLSERHRLLPNNVAVRSSDDCPGIPAHAVAHVFYFLFGIFSSGFVKGVRKCVLIGK